MSFFSSIAPMMEEETVAAYIERAEAEEDMSFYSLGLCYYIV